MPEDKFNWLALFYTILIAIPIIILMYQFLIKPIIAENNQFKQYESFCKDRPTFCYCDSISCEYKTSYTNRVPSKDTKELCDLATKLKDKEMIFKSCNG